MFVIVGVGGVTGQDTDIGVTKATWGVTGTYGGPSPMGVESSLVTAMGADCSSSGLNFNTITGVLWKAFATPTNKNDKDKFGKQAVIDVVLKAKADAGRCRRELLDHGRGRIVVRRRRRQPGGLRVDGRLLPMLGDLHLSRDREGVATALGVAGARSARPPPPPLRRGMRAEGAV